MNHKTEDENLLWTPLGKQAPKDGDIIDFKRDKKIIDAGTIITYEKWNELIEAGYEPDQLIEICKEYFFHPEELTINEDWTCAKCGRGYIRARWRDNSVLFCPKCHPVEKDALKNLGDPTSYTHKFKNRVRFESIDGKELSWEQVYKARFSPSK